MQDEVIRGGGGEGVGRGWVDGGGKTEGLRKRRYGGWVDGAGGGGQTTIIFETGSGIREYGSTVVFNF